MLHSSQAEHIVRILDYTRSFVQGVASFNRVRFVPESRTRIIAADGTCEDYLLCAACKSEDTFAASGLFYPDNYDFKPIFGPTLGVIFRRKARLHDAYRSIVPVADMWGGPEHRLRTPHAGQVRQLDGYEQVRDATDADALLVAQTQWRDSSTGLGAIVEYPVKTMNITDDSDMYQVDTGPIALPDLSMPADNHAERLSLAYVAINQRTCAEFVIEAPSAPPAAPRGAHTPRQLSLPVENRLYAIDTD